MYEFFYSFLSFLIFLLEIVSRLDRIDIESEAREALCVANGDFLITIERSLSLFRSKRTGSRAFKRSSRESTILVYLTNNVAGLRLPSEPDVYRERDLFLVFRIAKAFAEDTLACSLAQAAESIFPMTSFSRMALIMMVTGRMCLLSRSSRKTLSKFSSFFRNAFGTLRFSLAAKQRDLRLCN